MPRWEKHLSTWQSSGLLSPEQAAQIRQFEAQQPKRAWGVWGVLGIGATAVATGVISVVAANWEAIGAVAKLSSFFLLQAALSVALLRRWPTPGPVREVLLTLCSLLVLAGIGLIGQVYHLRSDGWQGLLLWLMLILPLTLLAEGRLLPHIWVGAGWGTALLWAEASRSVLTVGDRVLIGSAWPVACAALGLTASAASTSRLRLSPRFHEACRNWGIFGTCVVGSLIANVLFSNNLDDVAIASWGALVLWLSAGAGCAAVWSNALFPRKAKWSLTALFGTVAFGCTLPFLLPVLPGGDVFGALAFLAVWVAAAATCSILELRRLFDVATVAIALRLVVIYFEVFGSLAETGFGLIVSGLVIIAVALLWHRVRSRLTLGMGAKP